MHSKLIGCQIYYNTIQIISRTTQRFIKSSQSTASLQSNEWGKTALTKKKISSINIYTSASQNSSHQLPKKI